MGRLPRRVDFKSMRCALSTNAIVAVLFLYRTWVVVRLMPSLLLELWRELHPKAHEQTVLNFSPARPPAKPADLFTSGPPKRRDIDLR